LYMLCTGKDLLFMLVGSAAFSGGGRPSAKAGELRML
jgi:hypothetical protein